MIAPTAPAGSAASVTVESVRHWHVTESDAGCLPEVEPSMSTDAGLALDALAHLLEEWANTCPDPEDPEAVYADGIAEHYCTCRSGGRSAEHHDAMRAVEDGQGICEQIGHRVFELTSCREKDCLKYCPDTDCGTVAPVTDTDLRCWCCGTRYVDWETCGWLA
jgi:hypothetical protein